MQIGERIRVRLVGPEIAPGERHRQAGGATEIDRHRRIFIAGDHDGAGEQDLRRHPLEPPLDIRPMIFERLRNAKPLSIARRKRSADLLAGRPLDGARRIERRFRLDVGRLERLRRQAALFEDRAFDERRDKRRHDAIADRLVEMDLFRVLFDQPAEVTLEQSRVGIAERRQAFDHADQVIRSIEIGHLRFLRVKKASIEI